jgi:50S ribosomal subunit-associated GTPase HflX
LSDFAPLAPTRSQGLVDVLDRILDKGLVVAGDVRVNLANVELLTIQVRLLICSIDKAEQIGLTWWKRDPLLTGDPGTAALEAENRMLAERLRELEVKMNQLETSNASRTSRRRVRSAPDASMPPDTK